MKTGQDETPRHPIRVVSRRTGLTPALLRAWEKRYSVVDPSRSEGGQRLYSDEDVHRLSLLHRAVEEGRNISQVAGLSTVELLALVEEDRVERRGPRLPEPSEGAPVSSVLEQAKGAVKKMDPVRLERILTRGAMAFSVPTLTDEVLVPLLASIGSSWRGGELGVAQEHLASVVIRRFLEWLLSTVDSGDLGSVFVSTTPAQERHEFGALLSAVSAAAAGWKAVYLGPDLPASEIVAAVIRLEAKVLALSLVDPALGATFRRELAELQGALPESVRMVVGGPGEVISPLREEFPDIELMTGLQELRDSVRLGG
jgi:DNA-binding transcriptional MerR regulator